MDSSYDASDDPRADPTDVDDDLYQLNDIGLALRIHALREATEN